jgi:hypothetical protein
MMAAAESGPSTPGNRPMNTASDPSLPTSDAEPLAVFEETLKRMQDNDVSVAIEAYDPLLSAPPPQRLAFLERMVQSASSEIRQEAAILLGSTIAPETDAVVDAAMRREVIR